MQRQKWYDRRIVIGGLNREQSKSLKRNSMFGGMGPAAGKGRGTVGTYNKRLLNIINGDTLV